MKSYWLDFILLSPPSSHNDNAAPSSSAESPSTTTFPLISDFEKLGFTIDFTEQQGSKARCLEQRHGQPGLVATSGQTRAPHCPLRPLEPAPYISPVPETPPDWRGAASSLSR